MPKKRVADIARERGLEPSEVARRLAAAGVKLSGDTVDEAAAARALGGSRPARNGKRQGPPQPIGRAAPPLPPHPPAQPAQGAAAAQGQARPSAPGQPGTAPAGAPRPGAGAPARPG